MKKTKQLEFYQFYNPSELREYLSGFSDDSIFYEWTDGPGIPSYATVSILTDKKGLLGELEYWEDQKPGTEEYELCTYTECAHLGEGPIFSAESVSDCLEYHGYEHLAKRIGNYGFVTMNRMLSLYKVYGLYEKGKDNPYEIVCCLGKPEKDILEDENDEIRLISWHATLDDFGSIQNFLYTLEEDTDCSPIAFYEDDGNYSCVCELQDELPTYTQPPRPQLIMRVRKEWLLTKESQEILDGYDNSRPFGWLCYMKKSYFMKSSRSERVALGLTEEEALKKGQQKGKRRVVERGEKEKSYFCIPVTEAAYFALKEDLHYSYIHSTKTDDVTELIVFGGEKEYRFPY